MICITVLGNSLIQSVAFAIQHLRFHKFCKMQSSPIRPTLTFGNFAGAAVISGDQVPIPFVIGADTTWELKGSVRVAVKTPSEALKKRQCTLHVCFSPDRPYDKQPRGVLVFRGKGKRVDADDY